MKKSSLPEMMAFVFFILTLFLIVGVLIFTALQDHSYKAQDAMETYLKQLYPGRQIIGIACTSKDTNWDGYISCSATINVGTNEMVQEKQISAECATVAWRLNQGCRPMLIGYRQ